MRIVLNTTDMSAKRAELDSIGFIEEFAGAGTRDYVNHDTRERFTSYYRSRTNTYYFYDNRY